jgi:hypothetical protein
MATPLVEDLETRILLYSDLGDQWTYSSRITYSFMPDGTNVGGVPSALFQTLNAIAPTATWESQIEQAASLWEGATNANLALVSDGGEAVGCAGAQQDDPRFGDIRIGAVPLAPGILAETILPPPANGGTDAGDILLNSNVNWAIGSNYDLLTVTAHEFGHALGLGESTVSTAVMYGTYDGIKTALTSDDISGIDSIYGARQYDQFNINGHRNNTYATATSITSYISSNQIAIPSLDNTTTSDSEWYVVTVPSSTTGTMSISVQSTNLSSFAPKLQIYSASLSLLGQASAPNTFGATVTVSQSVQAGQTYYIKVLAASSAGAVGGYGLLANFGSGSQSPIPPPDTYVPSEPDLGGGSVSNVVGKFASDSSGNCSGAFHPANIGSLTSMAISYAAEASTGNPGTPNPVSGNGPGQTNGGGQSITAAGSVPSSAPVTSSVISSTMSSSATVISTSVAGTPTAPAIGVLQAIDETLAGWTSSTRNGRLLLD